MATYVTDPLIEAQIRAKRAETDADRFDEVWAGVYIVMPVPNIEHVDIAAELTTILRLVLRRAALGNALHGANVSDRERDWEFEYRCPDVVAVLKEGRAIDCGTHYCGGPDFLVEIVSLCDKAREKITFYGKIGVRELLVVDRDPWHLELYQLQGEQLRLAGKSRLDEPTILTSAVVPLSFRLLPGDPRPQIEVVHRDGVQRWIV